MEFAPYVVHTATAMDALLALGFGLLMALRLRQAYDRWWEARTLWGTLVNASRNLAVKVRAFARPEPDEARDVHALIAGFAYGLRDHLRHGARLTGIPGLAEARADPRHVPSWISGRLYDRFRDWARAGRVTDEELRTLDLEARVLLQVAGACERIRNTPIYPALTRMTRASVVAVLLLSAWGLQEELGWGLVPLEGIGAALLLMLELVASGLEHPFQAELRPLDLTGLGRAIDASTGEILGVPALEEKPGGG